MRSQPLPGAIKARAGWLWSSQGGAPVSGSEPWPPATEDLASAPRAHLTSERPAARAQLEFGRASSLAAAVRTAAGEDRTHDLRIMRPTRYQLRYCRSCCGPGVHICRPATAGPLWAKPSGTACLSQPVLSLGTWQCDAGRRGRLAAASCLCWGVPRGESLRQVRTELTTLGL